MDGANQSKTYTFSIKHAPSGTAAKGTAILGVKSIQGIDLLMNLTYLFTDQLSVFVEPGMQYAMQTADYSISFNGVIPDGPIPLPNGGSFEPRNSVQSSAFVPEVILGTNFQIMSDTPLFIGAYYQQIFGNNTSNANRVISDRSQIGVALTYAFGAK